MNATTRNALASLSGATFGDYREQKDAYRFHLFRNWNLKLPTIAFCMLNPSTADHEKNDPTVERCERRAKAWGFGRLVVVNLFALRSTDPDKLYSHPNPVGNENNRIIIEAAQESQFVCCAWGAHGAYMDRGKVVLFLLREAGFADKLRHLGLSKEGQPRHPLYISYKQNLLPFA